MHGVTFPSRPQCYRNYCFFPNAICRCMLEICLLFQCCKSRALIKQKLNCSMEYGENPFPWKDPAVSLLSLKGFDCCEAALFSSCPRATAGGEIINMAGKVKLGLVMKSVWISRQKHTTLLHLSALVLAKRLSGASSLSWIVILMRQGSRKSY